ncbi:MULTISPECIES: accessory Sec system glycosyltransferase GtfA [Aerococcus]|uniref:accessory Sec system glycosyltransferase GtfA n=1 Tax=Aerococcus urinae (strain CCUG 59500 / ACS-120-V-Col10a) TaxID=2976812 RepID=UPI000200E45E|nr:accessory Sec system glycosyltransferase GtfA [Aerococcus sp. Group 1]AEA01103.1 accessory Sec system glycosylation protein GtfA [Aerococcus sp. Group 1]MCY3031109.1 accessory Sec system glycosyltransferase GtfA [Aerococcus sp. Group 1]MCY3054255.1 accessory Sec system glycosyltransferase GtfA [Aerococcus sp. Group 1]MCY3055985.1 accessory Sec system glycosyltransferase GtfA [Aerococcus sp. Group 1]MCY3061869.1 accessory Sec system glycosyltransferase GtfA [Aerococcus sp. Group 1]
MTIYNINLGIGWASSGVEYSQIYRSRIFDQLGETAKFVFVDLILNENIAHFTQNIGFRDEDIIWMYLYFTDIKIRATSYRLADVKASLAHAIEEEKKEGDQIVRLYYDQGKQYATCYLVEGSDDLVNRVEFVVNGCLVRKDYYNYTRFLSEYYAPQDNKAKLYQRRYFNEDGSVAYEEIVDGDHSVFKMSDAILYNKEELFAYFIQKLDLSEKDIVILDRATGTGQAVFQYAPPAKIGVVIHAEHFSEGPTTNDYILWNNYYDYQFMHSEAVDFFIASTQAQKEVLDQQFAHYYGKEAKVYAIPVGSISDLKYPQPGERQVFSLMTASRLAAEKHVDWLVEAVARAKAEIPQITFDIYGKGTKETSLRELIKELGAEDYIQLKGHQDLAQVYQKYDLYFAGSTSEGFGLTLLEAIAAGLPIIGFEVNYGNVTFVEDGSNGYLVPYQPGCYAEDYIAALTTKLLKYYREADRQAMQEASYQRAQDFLDEKIIAAWRKLLEEVQS